MCPFQMEKELIKELGCKPKTINSSGRDSLLIEATTKEQGGEMASIKELLNKECKTKPHDFLNLTRGMIYVYNSEISDIKSFQSGLKTEYPIESVQEATWVTPRNSNAKAFVVSFTSDDIPSHLHIVGEYTNTKVYPVTDIPMQCKKCQISDTWRNAVVYWALFVEAVLVSIRL